MLTPRIIAGKVAFVTGAITFPVAVLMEGRVELAVPSAKGVADNEATLVFVAMLEVVATLKIVAALEIVATLEVVGFWLPIGVTVTVWTINTVVEIVVAWTEVAVDGTADVEEDATLLAPYTPLVTRAPRVVFR